MDTNKYLDIVGLYLASHGLRDSAVLKAAGVSNTFLSDMRRGRVPSMKNAAILLESLGMELRIVRKGDLEINAGIARLLVRRLALHGVIEIDIHNDDAVHNLADQIMDEVKSLVDFMGVEETATPDIRESQIERMDKAFAPRPSDDKEESS